MHVILEYYYIIFYITLYYITTIFNEPINSPTIVHWLQFGYHKVVWEDIGFPNSIMAFLNLWFIFLSSIQSSRFLSAF